MIVNLTRCDGSIVELKLDGIMSVRQGKNRVAESLDVPVKCVNLVSKEGVILLDWQSSEVLSSPDLSLVTAYNQRNEVKEDIEVVIEREQLMVAKIFVKNAYIREVPGDKSYCPISLRLGRK